MNSKKRGQVLSACSFPNKLLHLGLPTLSAVDYNILSVVQNLIIILAASQFENILEKTV
jgi:hypothetical protein